MNVCSSRSTATALEGDSYGDFDMSSKQVECLQSRTLSVHMPEHFNLLLNITFNITIFISLYGKQLLTQEQAKFSQTWTATQPCIVVTLSRVGLHNAITKDANARQSWCFELLMSMQPFCNATAATAAVLSSIVVVRLFAAGEAVFKQNEQSQVLIPPLRTSFFVSDCSFRAYSSYWREALACLKKLNGECLKKLKTLWNGTCTMNLASSPSCQKRSTTFFFQPSVPSMPLGSYLAIRQPCRRQGIRLLPTTHPSLSVTPLSARHQQ